MLSARDCVRTFLGSQSHRRILILEVPPWAAQRGGLWSRGSIVAQKALRGAASGGANDGPGLAASSW